MDSAARAGVGHVVKASSKASADSPIVRRRGQTEIEAGLTRSGLPHTLLRASASMQNILMLAPAIAAATSFSSSAGDGRIGMVDARDVGGWPPRSPLRPPATPARPARPTGPELVTNEDVAAAFSRLLGRPSAAGGSAWTRTATR